jgi:hypothetical protein
LWSQLTPFQPQSLWVGYLFLHHVEVPVLVRRLETLDPLAHVALHTLPLSPVMTLDQLGRRLPVGQPLLRRVLADLTARGLAEAAGVAQWRVTAQGQHVARTGQREYDVFQRRGFYFVDQLAGRPPAFLALDQAPGRPWDAPAAWSFSPAVLRDHLARSPEWKERHRFPPEVRHALTLDEAWPGTEPWQRVLLDRAEQLAVALAGGAAWQGFALDPATWELTRTGPVFQWDSPQTAAEVLGDGLDEPGPDAWRAAWHAWCRARNISATEVAACRLVRHGTSLQVIAPAVLWERLRLPAGQVPPAEGWLLAGDGLLRCAARLEVIYEDAVARSHLTPGSPQFSASER